MPCQIIEWDSSDESLGRAVVAIGVFDGVHVGHQGLVRHAADLAAERGVPAVAVTFDRDPDQVVTPHSAAPQLLTLAEKTRYLCEAGADTVLVIAFTPDVASLTPTEFLNDVLLGALEPEAVVVGHDFCFGRNASGTVDTLALFGKQHGFAVVPHPLVEAGGATVTSTRIRTLIAAGDVAAAAELLGRPHRVYGLVGHGRGEGAPLGVATANVTPTPFAALPADGVYAGRAIIGDEWWPAAISVGTPPMFPDATDVLEAHLIGFDADIYETQLELEFVERLRDQRVFASVDELVSAIREDIERASALADSELADTDDSGDAQPVTPADQDLDIPYVDPVTWDENPLTALAGNFWSALTGGGSTDTTEEYFDDGEPVVDDPAALDAAERAVAGLEPVDHYAEFDHTWVQVLGPIGLVPVTGPMTAFEITTPLDAEGVPYVWDPFSPQDLTTVRPDLMTMRRFRLFVPPDQADRARELLDPKWLSPEEPPA